MKLVKFALIHCAVVSFFLLAALSAQAGTTWDGGGTPNPDGSYNWEDKANWGGGSYPGNYTAATIPDNTVATIKLTEQHLLNRAFTIGANCNLTFVGEGLVFACSSLPIGANSSVVFKNIVCSSAVSYGQMTFGTISVGASLRFEDCERLDFNSSDCKLLDGNALEIVNCPAATAKSLTLTAGSSALFDNVTMTFSSGLAKVESSAVTVCNGSVFTCTSCVLGSDGTLELSDASILTVSGTCYMTTGGTLSLSGKSTFDAASHFKSAGVTYVIDDSTFVLSAASPIYRNFCNTGNLGDTFVFKGANPVFRVAGNKTLAFDGTATAGENFVFCVPVGGYVATPFQHEPSTKLFNGYTAAKNIHFSIDPDSPALQAEGKQTTAQLLASQGGTARAAVNLDEREYLFASGGGSTPATDDAGAKELWVTLGEGEPVERPVTESKGVAGGVKAAVGKKDITLTATISQLANETGYTTRLRVFAGTAADDLVEVTDEPVTVETKGEVAYVWDAPEYATDYFLKMTLETLNAGETVVYSEDSPVVSARTWYDINNTADYIYIWNPEGTPNADGSYNWADKNNWDYYKNRVYSGHNGYPVNSGSNLAYFGPNVKARVCIDLSSGSPITGNRQLAMIEVKPSAEIELFGTTTAYAFTVSSKLDATTLTVGEGLYLVTPVQKGVTIEVKEGGIINPNAALNDCTINVGEGGTLKTANALSLSNAFINVDAGMVQLTGNNGFAKVLDGGVTADNGSQLAIKSGLVLGPGGFFHLKGASVATWDSGTEYVKTGGTIWLEEKSTMVFHGLFKTGAGVETIIDDSTLEVDPTVTSNIQTYYMCDGAGGDTFVFRGENPILRTKALAQFSVTGATTAEGKGAYFKFEIPQMGYLEPPIQHQGTGGALFGLNNVDASNGKVHIEVLSTSPAFAEDYGYKTETQLFTTTKGLSLNPVRISTEAEPSASAVFEFTSSGRFEPTTTAADTKELWVTVGEGEIRGRGIKESKGVANGLTIDKNARTFTIACGISQLANEPGYTTRLRVLGGESGGTLTELGTIAVEQTGLTSYDWTVPEFAKDYDVKFVLETLNAGGAVTYTEESPIATDAAVDAATYTWKADAGGDWNGNWTDKAHWADDKDGDCTGYPCSAECKVVVPDGNHVEITVDGAFSVKEMKCTGASDVLFRTNAVGGTASTISLAGTFIVNNGSGSMTFDSVRLTDKNHIDFAGKKLVLDNGSSYAHGGSMSVSSKNAWVEVRNGSTLTVDKLWIGAGDKEENEGGLLVSNATASCSDLCGPINKDGHSTGWGYVKLQGTNPLLKVKSGCAAETAKATTRFVFEVPAGGYAATPFVFAGTGTAVCFNDTKANVSNIFTVVRTSPAIKDSKVEYPLMSWNSSGINREKVFFSPPPARHGGTPRFTWLYGTAAENPFGWAPAEGFDGTAVSIGFGVPMKPGFRILVR